MKIYGHRGAKGEAPENTLEGFIHAYKQGIRRFELDVQLSKDGNLVVIHDQTLERTTGVTTKVKDASFDEMRELDARKNTAAWSTPCHIPSLSQVVESCPDVEHWQFEVKPSSKARLNILCNRLVEYIQANKLNTQCVVTSSSAWFLKALRRRDPDIKIGFVAEYRFPQPLRTARNLGCEFLCLNYTLCNESLVKETRKLGMHLSCWTVNSIHEMLKLRTLGVDSIITDFPTSTLIYFENHGLLVG